MRATTLKPNRVVITIAPLIKTVLLLLFFSLVAFSGKAQSTSLPNYDMKFQFRSSTGMIKDTMLSRLLFKYWSKSANYPAYIKWKNQPFAIAHSSLSGVGLFTDSASSFNAGDTIGYAYYKIRSSGSFDMDYKESNIGSFINDSDSPNVEVIATSRGLIMRAKVQIGPNTELTASYQALIDMFPNDPSAKRVIQYW